MAGYSILVAEDEHTLRRLLEYRLSKLYDVRTAANGEEALAKIGERVPDLIISDIMMPKMDGFALQASLQDDLDTRAIPFIFLTAKADEQSRLKGERTGVDYYITKPFDIDHLLTRVKRLLDRQDQMKQAVFKKEIDRIGEDFSQKLMPKTLPDVQGYKTYFHNTPREHGGGDLFDWIEAKPGTYFITIGDVMGKGIQAKFYAYSFMAYVRTTIHTMTSSTHSPAEILTRVNKQLIEDQVMDETFASLLLMRWDVEANQITYANAGHCHPLLVTQAGTQAITESDMILGLDPATVFKDSTLILPPNSALLTYTDGLLEQRLTNGEMVGEGGLMQMATQAYGATDPIGTLLNTVLQYSEEPTFGDDILVFWMQREAKPPETSRPPQPSQGTPPRSPNVPQPPRWFSPYNGDR